MRTLTTFSMTAVLALVLGAGQASALGSFGLNYLGGATGTEPCTNGVDFVDCVHTQESDIITFAIVASVDSAGLGVYSVDIAWDLDGEDELDLVSYRGRASLNLQTSDVPPVSIGFNINPLGPVTDSGPGQPGSVIGISAGASNPAAPYMEATSFRTGVIKFHVTGNVNKTAGNDIEVGYFDVNSNAFFDGNFVSSVPNFGGFAVDSVPEPGTSLLMGMGVLGLILAGRASRKG